VEAQSSKQVWGKTCEYLKGTLSKDVYDRWISIIEPVELKEGELTLSVANDFYQTWLEENYLSLIGDSVSLVTGSALKVSFQVHRDTSPKDAPAAEQTPEPTKPVRKRVINSREFHLNPKYNFESFIVGSSNNFAHAATMAVAQSPAKAYNPLFLYGGVGLGKTHLMQAIGNYVISKKKSNICYISCEAFTNEYIDALQKKSLVQFRKKYRCTDLLLIDDIQFLAGKERMQEEFFHTFNALFDGHKQIVMTCDRPASEIPGLEHRLVSRFEWGLVTELEVPDLETRIAILRNKQEQMNLTLSDEVISFIAENIRANIRRLEGALIRAASYASLTGRELNMETLENLLRDTLDQQQTAPISMEDIQRVVAEYFDIRLGDMTSRKRPQNIAFPRQVAMYLCRKTTDQSLPSIGNAFARNHATVLHACRQIDNKIKNDPQFKQVIHAINKRLCEVH
jgi:chromosomal replication initiator protein